MCFDEVHLIVAEQNLARKTAK